MKSFPKHNTTPNKHNTPQPKAVDIINKGKTKIIPSLYFELDCHVCIENLFARCAYKTQG